MSSYGAIDDDVSQYYVQPQQRAASQGRSKFGRQTSYSSNAASIDQYLEMDATMDPAHNEFMIKEELEQRMYSNEFDLDIDQPRDIYKANHYELDPKPSHNLKCIWISLFLIIVFVIAAATCIDVK